MGVLPELPLGAPSFASGQAQAADDVAFEALGEAVEEARTSVDGLNDLVAKLETLSRLSIERHHDERKIGLLLLRVQDYVDGAAAAADDEARILVAHAESKASDSISAAEVRASEIHDDARRRANATVQDAETEARSLLAEAEREAARIVATAVDEADRVTRDAAARTPLPPGVIDHLQVAVDHFAHLNSELLHELSALTEALSTSVSPGDTESNRVALTEADRGLAGIVTPPPPAAPPPPPPALTFDEVSSRRPAPPPPPRPQSEREIVSLVLAQRR